MKIYILCKYNSRNSFMMWCAQICEDVPQVLDSDVPGLVERPINLFLPKLFQVMKLLVLIYASKLF